ncbi:MAG: Fic family protein [Lautropia sp.]|nr:Fic family protein [Lautropia sp.]
MICGDYNWVWQLPAWQQADHPGWTYDAGALATPLAAASQAQGRLLGRLADVGMTLRDQASLAALTQDVLDTSKIENEHLDVASVRSSVARRLGVDIGASAPADRHVDGVVDMVLDATHHARQPLSSARLFGWQAALFPTGYSGLNRIEVGCWRTDSQGPMQVVSGPVHRRRIHFQAPPASHLPKEMARFLAWANGPSTEPELIRAALAHLWFITLHPFDDGNGRIARAISDLFLARADGSSQRFYSLSAQIQRERKQYYQILERTQKGTLDVNDWLHWFLRALHDAIVQAERTLDAVLAKARFWQQWAGTPLNARQQKVLNRLLDGFDGRMTSSRWANICRCSPDTALRDINRLLALGMLRKAAGGGRSTAYEVNLETTDD